MSSPIIANVHKAKSDLSALIAAVLAGKSVIIAKNNEPVVELIKYQKTKKKSSFGILKGKIWMSDDFNDEDPEINKLFYGE